MKKILGLVLTFVILICSAFSLYACNGDASAQKGGLKYKKYSGDTEYTVYGFVLKKDAVEGFVDLEDGVLDIQAIVGDKVVGKIEENAFKGLKNITKIIIPSTVQEIGKGAFANMPDLEELVVPFIGKTAVADSDTTKPGASGTNKSIGFARTMYYWFATNVMDEDFCEVSNGEFDGGRNLTVKCNSSTSCNIYLPVSLKALTVNAVADYVIPAYACYGNTILETLSFTNVTEVGEEAFTGCINLSDTSLALLEE